MVLKGALFVSWTSHRDVLVEWRFTEMFKVDICFVAKKVCIQSVKTDVIFLNKK